jgi:hypothetical protein
MLFCIFVSDNLCSSCSIFLLVKMSTTELLAERGFSPAEIEEMREMISATERCFIEENPTINLFVLTKFEAEWLTLKGTSERVRDFARSIIAKLQQFHLA